MKIIQLHHPYVKTEIPTDPVVMVLGFFDGVHRGHQSLIKEAKKIAEKEQLKIALMTFDLHPSIVFQKVNPEEVKYLTLREEKEALMEQFGVDILYEVAFTSAFAKLSPEDFIEAYVLGLNATHVVAGFDYTYGPKDIANMENMPKYAKNRFKITVVQPQLEAGEKISSSRIREMLDTGQLEMANQLLGYPYQMSGIVVHGDARGRTLGFPTANIQINRSEHIPKKAVYAVKILVNGEWYLGMAQIGYNVTFEQNRPMTVEVYIIDFNEDIYGEPVTVAWYHYLRDEVKFNGIEQLVSQLQKDEQATIDYFKNRKN